MKEKIIIYGAGNYGKKLLQVLRILNARVDYFCQTEAETDQFVEGLKVLSLDEMLSLDDNKIVLIAMADKSVSQQIRMRLQTQDMKIVTYDCGSFIRDNEKYLWKSDGNVEQTKECIICGELVDEFLPYGVEHDFFLRHKMIGSGYRKNCICPKCNCMDRERWLYYVLQNYTDIFWGESKVLHFAPELRLKERITLNRSCDYYTGDITKGRADHIVDVTDMQFKDDIFDYVIVNHVLEHIENEEKAISELQRVVKPRGKIILSFPVCMDVPTLDDPSIRGEEERLATYGQKDHVRLYGYDFKERLEKYGLKVEVYSPEERCSKEMIHKAGFIANDILIIAEK